MARGVNKVILIGNCGQDPEIRYTANGAAVANVSLATSESWKDKQTGQPQERTEWHRLVFFGRVAEIVGEYVKKGSKIYAEGSLRTRKWTNNEGQDQYTTEIVVSDINLLSGNSGDGGGHGAHNNNQQPQQPQQPQQRPQRPQPANNAPRPNNGPRPNPNNQNNQGGNQYQNGGQYSAPPAMDSFDDDIPF